MLNYCFLVHLNSEKLEFIFVEIKMSISDVILGVYYRLPKVGHFENILLCFLPSYHRVLIMGNFNTEERRKTMNILN